MEQFSIWDEESGEMTVTGWKTRDMLVSILGYHYNSVSFNRIEKDTYLIKYENKRLEKNED